ncbi:MAG: hypothetical protein KAX64_00615 [Chromatiaceae bacterium]|nr:hypothetical protein [Chromatiaceae bacterium]
MEKLFKAMQVEFGSRWSSQFTTPKILADAKTEWGAKIANLTVDDIRIGLDSMDIGQNAWPPGPRAFVSLATAKSAAVNRIGAHALYLPKQVKAAVDREQALSDLAKLRQILPPDPVTEVADVGKAVFSLADRRAFIARQREALLAAGLGGLLED